MDTYKKEDNKMTMYMIQTIPEFQKEWRFLDAVTTEHTSSSDNVSDLLMVLADIIRTEENANVKNRYRIIDSAGNIIMKFDGRKLADREINNDEEVTIDLR